VEPTPIRPLSPSSDGDEEQRPGRRPSTKIRPNRPLPTDRMKFSKAVEALRATAIGSQQGQPVDARTLANLMHVSPATAALNHAFFIDVGLVTKVGKGDYMPSSATVEFARKYGFQREQAGRVLAPQFAATWFYRALSDRLQMGPVTRDELIELFANIAGADASYRVQIGSLIDWLVFVGLAQEDGENISLTEGAAPPAEDDDVVSTTPAEPASTGATAPIAAGGRQAATVVSLNLALALTADDLAKLSAEQIASLFQGVGQVAAIKAALAD